MIGPANSSRRVRNDDSSNPTRLDRLFLALDTEEAMNGKVKQLQARQGWGQISCIASRGLGIRSLQIPYWPTSKAPVGYCHATDGRQRQQRSFTGVLALFIGGPRLDVQGPYKTLLRRVARPGAYLLYQARQVAQQNQLVRRDLGTSSPSSRHGLWPAVPSSRRLRALGTEKRMVLYGNRTYTPPYKYGNRTKQPSSKYGNRSYMSEFGES